MRERALPQSGAAALPGSWREKSVGSRADACDREQHAARLGAGVSRNQARLTPESTDRAKRRRSIHQRALRANVRASKRPTLQSSLAAPNPIASQPLRMTTTAASPPAFLPANG